MLLPTAFRLLLAAWLVYVAVYDWRTWTVPWWTTWPVILAACLGHAWRGAWAPLALFALCFIWDTTVGDVKRLLHWRIIDVPRDDDHWLVPDAAAFAVTALLLVVARGQGEAAFYVHPRLCAGASAVAPGPIARRGCGPADRPLGAVPQPALPGAGGRRGRRGGGATSGLALPAGRGEAARIGVTAGPWAALTIFRAAAQTKSKPEPVAYLFSLAGIAALVWL